MSFNERTEHIQSESQNIKVMFVLLGAIVFVLDSTQRIIRFATVDAEAPVVYEMWSTNCHYCHLGDVNRPKGGKRLR